MKKIILYLLLLSIPLIINAQWYGDGLTPATAFYGKINADFPMLTVWNSANFPSGEIFVGQTNIGQNLLEIENGGGIQIEQGMTIKFCTTTSGLIISGTGSINAVGSPSNKIVFTRNYPSVNYWGNIHFRNTTSPSILSNCIINYGRKVGSGSLGYGGGIHVNTNNLTLVNCEIHNNTSTFGGGIFINENVSPIIKNCYIHNNTATASGGGLYLWYNSGALIENCIVSSNICIGTSESSGGGGIGIYTGSGKTKIINSTIVQNIHQTIGSKKGNNIFLTSSNNQLNIINCIIWGEVGQSVYIDTSPIQTNFISSALDNIYSSSGTVNIINYPTSLEINSINLGENPLGPFFNNTDGSDWSLQFFSPCRDAGTNSFTGVTIPATDYEGSERVYITDIGAYEYQYSRWRSDAGSTDWSTSANWHGGVPSSDRDIVIPAGASNYPTGSSAPNVTVGTGKYFIMEPGARATINSLTNNGNTLLQASETEHSSLITNSHSGNNANIEIYLRSGTFTTESGQFNRWHYISSPFNSLAVSVFTDTTINLAQWVESSADPSLIQGWIAYDGYNYGTGTVTGPTFSNLSPGFGYNYYYTSPVKYTLSGQINTSNVSRSLYYTDPDYPTQFGLNLTGNPFPSGLDWDAITADVSFPENTSKVLHYTKDDEHVYYTNGIGSIPGMNGIIPPMQGFFVKTYNETTPSLTLAASARVHDNIPQRYKGKQAIPFIRLSLFSGEYYSDNTVVRFDNEAKEGFDYDFDAVKYFISDKKSSAYTFTEGKKYAINGQPFPAESLELPLHLKTLTAGSFKITLSEIEELDNYRVKLKDNQENITIDLKVTPEYSFSAPAGTITDRFTIIISDQATNTELPAVTETVFRTWYAYGVINIVPDNDIWDGISGTVTLTDISGRRIASQGNVEFHTGTPLQIAAPKASGIYIVEIESGLKRWTGRVAVGK